MAKETQNPMNELLGGDVAESVTYSLWKPWEDGSKDPVMFRGIFEGYKVIPSDLGDGKPYPGYCFIDCKVSKDKPAPSNAYMCNSGMISDLARVKPGTEVALVYTGEKKNKYRNNSHGIDVYVIGKGARRSQLESRALLPMNVASESLPALPAHNEDAEPDFP